MNWGEYSEASMAFGKGVLYIVSIVLIYVFSFLWITHPIFLALFTKTLDMKGGEDEVILAVFLWIAVFVLHIGAFAYGTGLIAKNRERIKTGVKNLVERIGNGCSGTD
jgi:hypothetical protein